MSRSDASRSHRLWMGIRAASYIAAAAAGAASFAYWRRLQGLGRVMRRTAARPGGYREASHAPSSKHLTNAGWAEIRDSRGLVLGRARVMLAATGRLPGDGQMPLGELRSLRLTGDAPQLVTGRYWLHFEASQSAHAVEVIAAPSDGPPDIAMIRWDDLDLPPSMVERDAN